MSTSSGNGPDDAGASWAAESLPMSVRKELLERELKKLGYRMGESQGPAMQQQQQPQRSEGSSHPTADSDAGEHGT
ncbi:MAG: hypothetical protein K0R58_2437 [Ramlibacter sp.]|nr:hypothetical protein [Ramlibacter sp.]